MSGLVLKEVVARGTPPFEAEGFAKGVGFIVIRIKENILAFTKINEIKETDMRTN